MGSQTIVIEDAALDSQIAKTLVIWLQRDLHGLAGNVSRPSVMLIKSRERRTRRPLHQHAR